MKHKIAELKLSFQLQHLILSSNRRLSLPLRAFDRLETLRTLDLSECGLRELEQGIFHGLEYLEELRLQVWLGK